MDALDAALGLQSEAVPPETSPAASSAPGHSPLVPKEHARVKAADPRRNSAGFGSFGGLSFLSSRPEESDFVKVLSYCVQRGAQTQEDAIQPYV